MTYAFDPELAALVPLLPDVDLAEPRELREQIAEFITAGGADFDLTGLTVTEHDVDHHGAPDVRVRVFRPDRPGDARAALLYLHGGAFVMGSIDTEARDSAALAKDLGIVVASVEYRLAPEDPYPAGLDDCSTALAWLHEHAADFGIDATRLGVYRQSAGGGLAAALALRSRDRGGPPICFQFLGMPELDDRLQTPSMRTFVDTPMWNRPNAVLSWQHYLSGVDGDVPSDAAPARATDLARLPPTYISAMEFDPLRDEAIDYASRLLHAGVPVELHVFPGTYHGFTVVTDAAISRRAEAEARTALRRGLRLDAD